MKYFCLTFLLEVREATTKSICKEMRDYVLQYYPNSKISWALQNNLAINEELEEYLKDCVEDYDDYIAPAGGFAGRDWTDEQCVSNISDNLDLIEEKFGIQSNYATSYGWKCSQLELLKELGIDIVIGGAWSQTGVDSYSGDGAIYYPYYVSKTNMLVPAQSENDNTGIITMDSHTCDLVGNVWNGARFTSHPGDPLMAQGYGANYILNQLVDNNLNDFVLLNSYVEPGWFAVDLSGMLGYWKNFIDKLYEEHPDIIFINANEFNTWFRSQYSDTPEYKFIFTGSGYTQFDQDDVVRLSDPNLKNHWLFTKDGRCCVQQNLTTEAYEIIDSLSYRGENLEPTGKASKVNLTTGYNWKLSQDKSTINRYMVRKWQKAFNIKILPTTRSKFLIK